MTIARLRAEEEEEERELRTVTLTSNTLLDAKVKLVHGRQFMFNSKVKSPHGNLVNADALTDSGATGSCVSKSFAQQHKLQKIKLDKSVRLKLGDGVTGQVLTQAALIPVYHGDHFSEELFYIVDMKGYDLIFGTPWLAKHNPHINWKHNTMTFDDSDCFRDCLLHGVAVIVHSKAYKKYVAPTLSSNAFHVGHDIHLVSGYIAARMAKRNNHQTVWVYPYHFEDLENATEDDDMKTAFAALFNLDFAAFTQEDFDKFHDKISQPDKTPEEILKALPEWLHHELPIFSMRKDTCLAPHRPGVDHEIVLEDGKFPAQRMYGLSRDEGLVVKTYLEDKLASGEIRHSTSPYAAPVLVVKKPGGGLRVCVDYRQLNAITIKSRNAPPAIKETLARLSGVRYFTVLDIVAAFNRVRIREKDVEKTAFLTRYGLFEYLVMPFGLTNAPSTF